MRFEVDWRTLRDAPGFWYLATPYSDYPDGHEAAWLEACRIRGKLMLEGVTCYSPIAEVHAIARACGIKTDHNTWMADNLPKMQAAYGIIIVRLLSWDTSAGIADESKVFRAARKPVVFLDP